MSVEPRNDGGASPLATGPSQVEPVPVSTLRASVPSAEPCLHETQIKSCGMKVCFDCGAPLNTKAKQIAAMRGAA